VLASPVLQFIICGLSLLLAPQSGLAVVLDGPALFRSPRGRHRRWHD
jgi:hypothetical protein